jgi:hypothetical protein
MFEGIASAIFVHRLKARAAGKSLLTRLVSRRAKTTLGKSVQLGWPRGRLRSACGRAYISRPPRLKLRQKGRARTLGFVRRALTIARSDRMSSNGNSRRRPVAQAHR